MTKGSPVNELHPMLNVYANRRTIRKFTSRPLDEGDLDRIIEAGRRAPSGGSAQIYSVIRITDVDLRHRLAALAGDQQHIRDAAECFIFCLDVHRVRRLLEHRGGTYSAHSRVTVHYGTMDGLLPAANMATAAEALGYGTCFIGAILNHLDAVARELQLPRGVVPLVGLVIGVTDTAHDPPQKPRLPRHAVFHENVYREPAPSDLDAAYRAMGDQWFATLRRYFGPGGTFTRRERVWLRTLAQQGMEHVQGEDADD